MTWLKAQIANCVDEKNQLTADMEDWYAAGNIRRFPSYRLLDHINKRLSHLDSSFKLLWDKQAAEFTQN
jgi:hypothetical protein